LLAAVLILVLGAGGPAVAKKPTPGPMEPEFREAYRLSQLEDRSRVKDAVAMLERAAKAGHARAMTRLAEGYLPGGWTGAPDPARATAWLRRASDAGEYYAGRDYAIRLRDGVGTQADPAEAARRLAAMADARDQVACFELAKLLLAGKGVARDPAEAARRLEQAIALRPSVEFLIALARLVERGDAGVPKDEPRARELYTRAIVTSGNDDALDGLAAMYEDGRGGPPDKLAACRLYRLSDSAAGRAAYARLFARLTPEEIAEMKARPLFP
jgi:TPR repeat protein